MMQADSETQNKRALTISSVYQQLGPVLNGFRLSLGGSEDLGTVYHFTRVPALQLMFTDEVWPGCAAI